MNQKAHCGYERDNMYAHTTLASTSLIEEPVYSKQIEQELFEVYFCHFHPFFPVLDKHQILQSQKFDKNSIPYSLKSAIMAISLSNFTNNRQNSVFYYQQALDQMDHTTSLSTVQTLFLLYKYQEMVTPVGTPISSNAIGYLKEAQSILSQLPRLNQGTRDDEFISRAEWLLFIILTFGNSADKRWREALDYCTIPNKKPELTEIEHYDKNELNTTCNFIHLANIALVYSPTICLMSDQNTLFSNLENNYTIDFNNLSFKLEQWKTALPRQITQSLFAHPPNLYSVQDISKNSSFTTYICLIYDILSLLIAIHQPNQQHDLSKMALAICFRAHCLTVGDMEPSRFSRLASIQGSRLISFGLTLALQTQSYCHQKLTQQQEALKNFQSCCSLAFQIFDEISLSPQLYMTIQAFRNQIESEAPEKQGNYITHTNMLDSNSSSESSRTFSSSSAVDSNYFYNMTTTTVTPTSQQVSHPEQNNTNGEWQQYTSYTTHDNFQSSWDTSDYQVPQDNMPITPTLQHADNPSPVIVIDSCFEQSFGLSVMVSNPYNFINNHPTELLYDSKSCRSN